MNTFNFIEKYKILPKLCDDLVDYYKNNNEYKFDRQDILNTKEVIFYNDSNNKVVRSFFDILLKCVTNYMIKYKLNNKVQISKTNNIQHYQSKTGYVNLHYEKNKENPKRQLVYMVYLNTIKKGGGTEFPFQNTIIKAIKGNLIIWPADFTHPHKGIISETEEKYIATGWLEII